MPIVQRTVREGEKVYNDWTQPERAQIFEDNKRVMADRSARKMGWAEPHLRIPELDLELLKQRNPELASPDGVTKRRAWIKFYNSPASAPYRVRVRSGGATNRSVGGI